MEALESPPNRNDPRLSQSGPRLSQPAGEAADPQSPIALSSDPEVHLADPTALTQLLGSVDGGSGHQAADLVAQLATGGMSAEMLMEALQTLPKVEIISYLLILITHDFPQAKPSLQASSFEDTGLYFLKY